MIRKMIIEEIPVTQEPIPEKRLVQARGELALISDGKPFLHLGYFSLKRGDGFYRGNHYHKNKVEHFYVVSGRLRVHLVDLDTGDRSEVMLEAGKRATLYPNCAHRFEAEEDAQVIEYYNGIYDPHDDIPHYDFGSG